MADKAGKVLGEATKSGFDWGLIGGLAGLAVVPGLAAWGLASAGASAFFIIAGAVVAGVATAPFTLGAAAVGGLIGGAFGARHGAGRGNQIASNEQAAERYQEAYAQTMGAIQNAAMQQNYVPAQTIPEAGYNPAMQAPDAMNDNRFNEATTQIDAATAAHAQTVDTELAAGKGM